MRGKFITLEGIDGAGKSTHLAAAARLLRRRGIPVVVTREPGGTRLGERLRQLLLERGSSLHPETETLLMFAARREHLQRVISPALAAGRWVLCDRFTDATFAYQSGGSGVNWKKVRALENWVHGDLQPDLTLLFDISPAIARTRAGVRGRHDRFEREKRSYFLRVREAYLRRAFDSRGRICIIDAGRTRAEVKKQLEITIISCCFK